MQLSLGSVAGAGRVAAQGGMAVCRRARRIGSGRQGPDVALFKGIAAARSRGATLIKPTCAVGRDFFVAVLFSLDYARLG